MVYKSMQPYPLRDDIFRIQTEGEYAKNAPDVRGNVVKLLKFSSYLTNVEKASGTPVPKLANLKKNKSPTHGYLPSPRNVVLNKDNSLERIIEEDGPRPRGLAVNFSAMVNE